MSLAKKLQREIKASPAKAAGLGGLLLVAAYFWAPLLKGYIGHAQAEPAPAAVAAAPATPASPPPAAGPEAPKPPEAIAYDWQRYAQLMDDDAKMRSVAELPNARDPFESRQAKPIDAIVAEAEAKPRAADAPAIAPKDAGLVLSSTFVGSRRQIALIGGKPYQIGDRVRAPLGDAKAVFKLVDVQPRLIVLERNGKQYELAITRGPARIKQELTSATDEDDESEEGEESESEMPVEGKTAR